MISFLSNPAILCAAGASAEEFFNSLLEKNQSGIKRVKCAERDFFAGVVSSPLESVDDKADSRFLRLLSACLSKIAPTVEKAKSRYGVERVGLCLGQCDNGSERSLFSHESFFKNGEFLPSYSLFEQSAQYAADFAAKKLGISSLALSFSTACASSASAISFARSLILSGKCDAVVAGGVDIASKTTLLGFSALEAVSPNITNPMSANRSGITLGEGAAFFVLSKDDLDETNIALLGAGESSDAFHITSPREDGAGAALAMNRALLDAKLSPQKIDYVNLHATGTRLNDAMEARAMAFVFGENSVPASGTKPLTGHTLGAAGAIELAAGFLSVSRGYLFPHTWDCVQDKTIPSVNLVQNAKEAKIDYAMSNSFAFGGCNVSLILGKAEV